MGNDVKQSVEEPEDRDEVGETFEAQKTEELNTEEINAEGLTEVVILDESETDPGSAPETSGSGEDDVYVILPEADTSQIPVVETQVLDDTAVETGDLTAVETMALGPDDRSGGITDPITANVDDAIEEKETQNLDELTSELDDEVLAAAAGMTSAILPVLDDDPAVQLARGSETGGAEVVTMPRRRRWGLGLASAAALLVLAAGGVWYLGEQGSPPVEHVIGGPDVDPPVVVASTTDVPPAQGGTDPVTTTAVEGLSPSELEAQASRELFRGKLLVALHLGFGVEVKNE